VEKPEGKRPLGRPRRNGMMILNGSPGSGMWGMDWTEMALDRDRWRARVNAIMNLRVL
jgi:hypothetical protein